MAITLDGTNGITSPDFEPSSSTTPTNGLFLPTTNTLAWATNSTERLRIDASGNLGLGVTPSGWYSTAKALQMGTTGSVFGRTGNELVGISSNAYNSGVSSATYAYIASGNYATNYLQTTGQHQWFTAPSGTAGNAISFTQAMTLDASGNLGIGTSSPVKTLHVSSGSYSNPARIQSTGGTQTGIEFINTGSNVNPPTIGSKSDALFFETVNTERARIDSSGQFLLGTTSVVDPNGAQFVNAYGFARSGAEFRSNTTSGHYAITFRNPNGLVGNIITSGTTTAYNTSSDQRLKENIVDAPSALSSVNAIKVRSFDWKSDGSHVDYGYIAQELLEVAPESVNAPDNPDEMMGVDFGKLTPRLVKAIQELTARLEALENK